VVNSAGNYSVTVANANACSGTGPSAPTAVTVNAQPTAAFSSAGTVPVINFTNTSTGASTYSWDFGDGNSSSQNNPTHVYQFNGTYTVCLTSTSAAGCSDMICHTVNINTAVQEIENISSISLYPNPLSNEATLEFSLAENAEVKVMLFDLTGNVVYSTVQKFGAGSNKLMIDASEIPNGMYFTRIVTDNVSKTLKTSVIK
jgi:PKD repeat protein